MVTEADGITFRNAVSGNIEAFVPEIWDSGTDTWLDDTGPWARLERRRVILSNPADSKMMKLDQGPTRDGLVFGTILQREGLGLALKNKNGDTIVDFGTQKMVSRIWPKVSTTSGGTISIRLGAQQTVGGPTLWGAAVAFDPEQTVFADPGPSVGRALGIEFSRTGSWRIDGYKIEVAQLGKY